MSLLDTLAPPDVSLEDVVPDGSLLQTTAQPDVDDPEMALLSFDDVSEAVGGAHVAGAQSSGPPVAGPVAKPKTRRKRVKAPTPADPGGKLSRSEIGRHAANVRWNRQDVPAPMPVPQGPPAALGPAPAPGGAIVLHAGDGVIDSVCALALHKPLSVKHSMATEKKVFKSSHHIVSSTAIAQYIGISRPTVQRKMRLMAACILFGVVHRYWMMLRAVIDWLRPRFDDYKAVMEVQRQRYDEFQIKVRLNNLPGGLPAQWATLKAETVSAKLMQVTETRAALFRAGGRHFVVEGSLPTTIRPIESTHGECVLDTLTPQSAAGQFVDVEFERKARVSISDNHPSNALADAALWAANSIRILLRWLCLVHVGHKIAELQWASFPGDLKGLMASTLAFHGPGTGSQWKRGIKAWVRARTNWFGFGTKTLNEEARRYNDKVFSTFSKSEDTRLTGPRARQRQKTLMRRKRTYSGGDMRLVGEIEHICTYPGCCNSIEDFFKLHDTTIDEELYPAIWATNRWLGAEDSIDFHGFWMSNACLYMVGVLVGWFKMDFDAVAELLLEWVNEALPEVVASDSYQDTTKEMTDIERQTTYRANVKLWLSTGPRGRIWVLKAEVCVQQGHQKKLLRTSGANFEYEQVKNVHAGKSRQYKPLMAYRMELTDKTLEQYARLLVDDTAWEGLPSEFKTHSLSMATFRSTTKAAAALYQLEKVRNRSYPSKGFGILDDDESEALKCAEGIIHDFENVPCILDPWTYEEAVMYPTIGLQLSAERKAKARLMAMLSELENAVTESNNAAIRRRIKQHLQQHLPHLVDVVGDWVMKWSRQEQNSIWGSDSEEEEEEEQEPSAKAPSGGRYRGFMSLVKDDCKNEAGKVCFDKVKAAFDAELATDPNNDLMQRARDEGDAAMRAGRAAQASGARSSSASSFGTVRPRDRRNEENRIEQQMLLDEFEANLAAASGFVEADGLQLALIDKHPMDVISDLVIAKSGRDIGRQIETLDVLARAQARKEAEVARKVAKDLKAFVSDKPVVGNIDFSEVTLPEKGTLKVLPDILPIVHFHDPCQSYAQSKVAEMTSRKSKIATVLQQSLEKSCMMRYKADLPEIGHIAEGFRPTYCFKLGASGCLCAGVGICHDIFRRKLNGLVTLICPPKTLARKLLVEGWLFVRLGESSWWHDSLQYLNPIRGTYMSVRQAESLGEDRFVLKTVLVNNQLPMYQDVEIARDIVLDRPLNFSMYKLIATDAPVLEFTPGKRLLVEGLHKHIAMEQPVVQLWKGFDIEMRDEFDRRKRQAEKAAAARAKARVKAAPAAKPAMRPPRPRRVVQRPRGAGLRAPLAPAPLPLQDGAPLEAAAPRPVFLVEGEIPTEYGDEGAQDLVDIDAAAGDLPGGEGFSRDWQAAAAVDVDADAEGGGQASGTVLLISS